MRASEQRSGGSAPPGGLRKRGGRRVALAAVLALGVLAAGCVEDGTDPGSGGGTILGGWQLTAEPACTQSLAFASGGGFVHGVVLALDSGTVHLLVRGRHDGSTATDAGGTTAASLTPDAPAGEPALAYCDSWRGAARYGLDFAMLTAVAGSDPATLEWRRVALPGGSAAWLGADGSADRLALVRDGDVVRAFAPDAGLPAGETLFHRVPQGLPDLLPGDFTVQVVNLPQQGLLLPLPAGQTRKLAFSLHSAVEVDFAQPAGAADPACTLAVYDSVDFTTPLAGDDPLSLLPATLTLNPGAAEPLLEVNTVLATETLHLLPVRVTDAAGGPCALSVRARPLAARLVVERAAALRAAGAPPLLTLAGGHAAYLLGAPVGQPGRVRPLPLARQAGAPWPALRLANVLFQPPLVGEDALGLLPPSGATGADVRLTVQSLGAERILNLFGDASLGPYVAHAEGAEPAPQDVAVPGSAAVALDSASREARYRFTLSAPALVEMSTDGVGGPVATTGALRDARGTLLARHRGGGPDGAPDGAGFRIVAALPAGAYTLTVGAPGLPAAATLHLGFPTGAGLPDPALEACLLGAGVAGAAPGALRTADCAGAGIASLAGIGAYAGLQALRLDGNPVADLTPLTALPALAVLSLAATPVADLTPLASLPVLHGLSLARTALDAAAVPALAGLSGRLTRLDLSGAGGLSDDDLAALQAGLPNARIVRPDGTVTD